MTEQEFRTKALGLIRLMVDTIADREYIKLLSSIPPEYSWADWNDAEPTPENGCLGFGQWLDEQLAMWEEDYDEKYVVDHFDEACLGEIELENDNTSFVTYHPTNAGKELDFWFEIKFKVEEDGRITAIFDVNI